LWRTRPALEDERDLDNVSLTFKAPDVPFAATIAQTPIVPKHIWSTIPNPVTFTNTHPVGIGPFTLGSFAPTQYTLTKNPLYWDASKIAPSSVVFPAQATSQSTNQLEVSSGQFDWAYQYLPDVKATYVNRDQATNHYWFPPGGTIGLYLNLTQAPYNNLNFRQGISLALNRATIAKKAVNGYMPPASTSGIILPNEQQWLSPSLPKQGMVSQNIPAAMAAFAKAGYTLRGGKLVGPNGAQASMTIVLPNNFTDWAAAATEISAELGKAGIKVSLDEPQYAQYSQTTQAGTFNAAIGGFGGTGIPYNDFNLTLNSAYAAPVHTPTVTFGLISGYRPGLVDEVLSFVTNLALVIPALPLMIILAAYLQGHSVWTIVLVVAFTSWATGARVIRSQTTTLRTREFVTSAVFSGERLFRVVFREILPNMTSLVAASFFAAATAAVLAEASLEFLGLGNPAAVSWGTILHAAETQNALLTGQWLMVFAPGLAIVLLMVSFTLINFGVDALSNPRLREK
jgi:hypothetical protein